MSMLCNVNRVYHELTEDDLLIMKRVSLHELDRFINQSGNPPGKYRVFEDKLIAVCLCQGAAQHFVEAKRFEDYDKVETISSEKIDEKDYKVLSTGDVLSGVKDIDILFFFREDKSVKIPKRRFYNKNDFASFKVFGLRRFDLMKTTIMDEVISLTTDNSPSSQVRSYLINTKHGKEHLSKASVVGLFPDDLFGKILWKTKWVE